MKDTVARHLRGSVASALARHKRDVALAERLLITQAVRGSADAPQVYAWLADARTFDRPSAELAAKGRSIRRHPSGQPA